MNFKYFYILLVALSPLHTIHTMDSKHYAIDPLIIKIKEQLESDIHLDSIQLTYDYEPFTEPFNANDYDILSEVIKGYTSLTHLTLSEQELNYETVPHVMQLLHNNTSITDLTVKGAHDNDARYQLAQCTTLKKLTFSGTFFGKEGKKDCHFGKFLSPSIIHLTLRLLSANHIKNLFYDLAFNTTVTYLSLDYTPIHKGFLIDSNESDQIFPAVIAFLNNNKTVDTLDCLCMDDVSSPQKYAEFRDALRNNPSLTDLDCEFRSEMRRKPHCHDYTRHYYNKHAVLKVLERNKKALLAKD